MGATERNQGALADALERLRAGASLTRDAARAAMEVVLRGAADETALGDFLIALREKGETTDELVGLAEAMRAHATPLFAPGERPEGPLLDTCGTGGDAAGTFNVSTAAALVAAAASARVAKHGNRSVSSRCGSADVLEALGVNVALEPARIAAGIRRIGFGFLFAPAFHTATRHAQDVRRKLGGRTVFNLLGPLTNPAGVEAQVVGVFDARWLEPMARALAKLGVKRAFVVHSRDGLDEASLSEATELVELNDSSFLRREVAPEDFGLARAPRQALAGGDAAANAGILQSIFAGTRGPQRDFVVMNAALALVAAGLAGDFLDGAKQAAIAIDSGAARNRLRELVEFSNRR
jgi:anthranilate phosphoribosyltransferase